MSGWTTATINFQADRADEAKEALEGDSDLSNLRTAGSNAVTFTLWGYGTAGQAKARARELMSEGDQLVIAEANDTSDSGSAVLYELEEYGFNKIDGMDGYEGARGKDAVGYLRKEYSVKAYVRG